jgi:hypothetical protein
MSLQTANLTYSGVGDRHVLMMSNSVTDSFSGTTTVKTTQLTGQSGNYACHSPLAQKCPGESVKSNEQFSLGTFSRSQRDTILEMAHLPVNTCRIWTRDLLKAMVVVALMLKSVFLMSVMNAEFRFRLFCM